VPWPSHGVRRPRLSRRARGPWCTQTLADLGADVIKVEKPPRAGAPGGDDTRGWGPFLRDRDGHETAEAAYYLGTNRNKRSVTIDIATARGAELVQALAERADVLVENFKVGDLARRGLDAGDAALPHRAWSTARSPGSARPARQQGGARATTTRSRHGRPDERDRAVARRDRRRRARWRPAEGRRRGRRPLPGMYATVAILAALRHRDRTGQGQAIDMALLDTQVAMLANLGAGYLASGRRAAAGGQRAPENIVRTRCSRVADGHLIVAVGNDGQFRAFCAVAGCPELANDARFARQRRRVRHRARARTMPRGAA
jgi:crotonobetainyl-CoA:carnitine CoA-transferase CaiB-like acyl-CoA transferase